MLAQRLIMTLAERDRSKMIYWAAMEPTDSEDRSRIEKHVEDRAGWGFETVECPRSVTNALSKLEGEVSVLFDSITALTANEMFGTASEGYLDFPDAGAQSRVVCELDALSARAKHTVFVCDNVFCDGESFDEWTENYCRALAGACRKLAENCDVVCEVVCGVAKPYKGELPPID